MKEIFFLSFHNFISNKKQSLATIIAVALTSMLLFSVCIAFSTYKKYQLQSALIDNKTYHTVFESNINELVLLKKDENIERIHTFYETDRLHYDALKTEEDFDLVIMSADFNYEDNITMMVGDYPKNENEIIVSDAFATLASSDLGDFIYKYEIVGIYSSLNFRYTEYDKFTNRYSPLAFAKKNLSSTEGDAIFLVEYKTYKNIYKNIASTASELNLGANEYIVNGALLAANGAYKDNKDTTRIYLFLITFLMIISLFCFMIIHNSFAITFANRQKNYGILRSIGGSKKHIFCLTMFEVFFVLIIGNILGYTISVLFINLMILIINRVLINFIDPIQMAIKPSFILLGLLFSFVVILFSAVISAFKACQTSPLRTIRNYQKIKTKKIKEDYPLVQKLLGPEGELAFKNHKRLKAIFIYPIITLTVCFILFISVSTFVNYLVKSINYSFLGSADIVLDIDEGDANKIAKIENEIDALNSIDNLVKIKRSLVHYNSNKEAKMISFIGLDNKNFNEYQKLLNTESKYILFRNSEQTQKENANEINLCKAVYKDNDYYCTDITYVVKDYNVVDLNYLNLFYSDSLIVNYDTYNEFFDNTIIKGFIPDFLLSNNNLDFYRNSQSLNIYTSDYQKLDASFKEIIDNNPSVQINYTNISLLEETDRLLFNTVLGVLYTIIGFIALICILNIFNIMNSNMEKRKMDFAILRSLGLSQKALKKMLTFESIFLFLGVIILGLPLSLLVVYIFSKIAKISTSKNPMPMPLPFKYYLIAIAFLILLIIIIMMYNFSKIKKQDLIETIRNEVL